MKTTAVYLAVGNLCAAAVSAADVTKIADRSVWRVHNREAKLANEAGRKFVRLDGHTVYRTGGGGPGFRSNTKMFPDERIGFVVMTNSGVPQMRGQIEPPESSSGAKPPPLKKKGLGKKSPGKMGPGKNGQGGGHGLQGASNPARELEQVITQVITARL